MQNKKENLVRIYPLVDPVAKQAIHVVFKANQDVFKSEGDVVRKGIDLIIKKYTK